MDVSVLVPVLNEVHSLPETLAAMRAQRFPGTVEFLLLDGGSTDGSLEMLHEAARADARLRVLHNPAGAIPHALNIGLRSSRGAFIARMDAHTRYPPDYLAVGVRRLQVGGVDWVSGPPIPVGRGRWSRRVQLALRSPLGVGAGGVFRSPDRETVVPAGFTGVWRTMTLAAHGGWDEAWPVNEDAELAARMRAHGQRIVALPEMAAHYVPRDSPSALARQYCRWGVYRAKTSGRHPDSMRRGNVLPPGLVLTVAASLAPLGRARIAARALLVLYLAVVAGVSTRQARVGGLRDAAALPAVYLTMHVSWGLGFIVGCARFGIPWAGLAGLARTGTNGAGETAPAEPGTTL